MIGLVGKTLHSERLTYRLLADGDRAALAEILRDPSVTRPAGFPALLDSEAFEKFWQELTAANTAVAILLGESCIGYFHVNPYRPDGADAALANVGIGFVIGRKYHRRGYAAETVRRLTAYLLTRFDNVWGDYFIENEASRKTLLRCGFEKVDEYEMCFEELGETKQVISTVLRRGKEEQK